MHSAEPAGSTLRENRRYREIPPRFVTVRVYILNSRRTLPENSLATFLQSLAEESGQFAKHFVESGHVGPPGPFGPSSAPINAADVIGKHNARNCLVRR